MRHNIKIFYRNANLSTTMPISNMAFEEHHPHSLRSAQLIAKKTPTALPSSRDVVSSGRIEHKLDLGTKAPPLAWAPMTIEGVLSMIETTIPTSIASTATSPIGVA
jgi:hypothetical protein